MWSLFTLTLYLIITCMVIYLPKPETRVFREGESRKAIFFKKAYTLNIYNLGLLDVEINFLIT